MDSYVCKYFYIFALNSNCFLFLQRDFLLFLFNFNATDDATTVDDTTMFFVVNMIHVKRK